MVRDSGKPGLTSLPDALSHLDEIMASCRKRRLAVFLDFDGTLAPIADRPELAEFSPEVRKDIERLSRLCPVAIVSGRGLDDVRKRIGIEGIHYVGSHGFEIDATGEQHEHPGGVELLPTLETVEAELRAALGRIQGAQVERKRFSISAHYRLARPEDVATIEAAVDDAVVRHSGLIKTHGKKVFELKPDVEWDKGKAVIWLLQSLAPDPAGVLPLYIGDDITDEDAFRAIAGHGIGIAVLDQPRPTAAQYQLSDPVCVHQFLMAIADSLAYER